MNKNITISIYIVLFLCTFLLGFKNVVYADTVPKALYSSTSIVNIIDDRSVDEWTKNDTVGIILLMAWHYHVDEKLIMDIVECETGHDIASTTIQSRHYRDGVREESYGLVQINLPSNPDISYEQAIDPYFSIEFLAKKLSDGKGYLWSCYEMVK